jgi:hypothetical protein
MAVDWSARLREQSRFVMRMANEVPAALGDPSITHGDAEQLFQTVENCALSFDAIVDEMHRGGAETSQFRAATAISAIWLDLTRLAADRMRDFQHSPRRRGSV